MLGGDFNQKSCHGAVMYFVSFKKEKVMAGVKR